MNFSTVAWLSIAFLFVYIASVDPNVPLFFVLWGQRIQGMLNRAVYVVKIHPETPWMRYRIWRNGEESALRIARDLGLDKNKDWYDN